jgi:hypothetical protein
MTATPTSPKALIAITRLAAPVSVGSSESPVFDAAAPELLPSEAEAEPEPVSSAEESDEVEVEDAPTVPVSVVIWPALVTDPAVTVTGM